MTTSSKRIRTILILLLLVTLSLNVDGTFFNGGGRKCFCLPELQPRVIPGYLVSGMGKEILENLLSMIRAKIRLNTSVGLSQAGIKLPSSLNPSGCELKLICPTETSDNLNLKPLQPAGFPLPGPNVNPQLVAYLQQVERLKELLTTVLSNLGNRQPGSIYILPNEKKNYETTQVGKAPRPNFNELFGRPPWNLSPLLNLPFLNKLPQTASALNGLPITLKPSPVSLTLASLLPELSKKLGITFGLNFGGPQVDLTNNYGTLCKRGLNDQVPPTSKTKFVTSKVESEVDDKIQE